MFLKNILIYSCFMAHCALAQPSREQADSLKNILRQYSIRDSSRVLTLIRYANDLFYIKPDSNLMKYADEALQIAEELKWGKGIANSLQLKAVVYQYFLSDPVRALDYYQKALKINASSSDQGFQWRALVNIGNIYLDLEEYKQALGYYDEAYTIMQGQPARNGEDQLLMNMGHAYNKLNQNAKAEEYYTRSINLAEKSLDVQVLADALCSRGFLYRNENNLSLANSDLQKGTLLAEKYNFKSIRAVGLVNLAEMYIDLKDYKAAEQYAKEALRLTRQMDMRQLEAETIGTLADLYNADGNAKKALAYYRQYLPMHDSLLSDETKQSLTRMEMQYQFQQIEDSTRIEYKKQQDLTAAELLQQHLVNSLIIGGAGMMLLAGLTSFIFYKKRRDAEGQKQEAELQTQIVATEMKALRAQINPHFIVNSLGSVRAFILKNNNKEAEYYLNKFSGLMRLVLYNSTKEEISLADDLNALERYIQMEALRLNNKFTYEIKIDDAIDKDAIAIPPLILQPFVENSIKHGISSKEEKGEILIAFEKKGNMLNCIVQDNGIGRAQAAMIRTVGEENNGKGIELTRERIAIINTSKTSKASILFSDLEEGLRVEIKLPWRNLENICGSSAPSP